jgi:hypothetical protein
VIIHIIACLLALIGVIPAVTYLSPIKVGQRAVPLIMIITSLIIWFVPTGVAVAMALVPVAAWISARLGIEHAGHEPVNVAPAVELAKRTAQAARERVRRPEPVEVKQFVDRAYPAPGEAAEAGLTAAADVDDKAVGEDVPSPAEQVQEHLGQLARDPRLPAQAHQRLMGQRAGRNTQPGLRNQTISAVPKFVPSLLS